jgi:hypothetical protein
MINDDGLLIKKQKNLLEKIISNEKRLLNLMEKIY